MSWDIDLRDYFNGTEKKDRENEKVNKTCRVNDSSKLQA
jgi:hypothetical protein